MVDQFQAFLLLGLSALLVIIVIRVIQSDRAAAKPRRTVAKPNPPQPRR